MIHKLLVLTACSLALCSSSLSAATVESIQDIKAWLPKTLHPHVQTIHQRVRNEEVQSVACGADTDYGFSIRGINPLQNDLLKEIAAKREATNTPPNAADLGSGLGAMTWKMILAGAHVTAVELQNGTANAMRFNVAEKLKNIPYGAKFTDRYRPVLGNAVTFNRGEQYDITWAGYLLHFLPPNELEQYVQNVYNITKEGGLTYATVNAPCLNIESVSLYMDQEIAGNPYPGYMMMNKEVYRSYNVQTAQEKNTGIKTVGASPILPEETLRPGTDRHGLYPTILDEPKWDVIERKTHEVIFKREAHSVFHYMRSSFLKNLFEKAGFEVEQLFYMTETGPIAPENMTEEFLANNFALLGIKARKPHTTVSH